MKQQAEDAPLPGKRTEEGEDLTGIFAGHVGDGAGDQREYTDWRKDRMRNVIRITSSCSPLMTSKTGRRFSRTCNWRCWLVD